MHGDAAKENSETQIGKVSKTHTSRSSSAEASSLPEAPPQPSTPPPTAAVPPFAAAVPLMTTGQLGVVNPRNMTTSQLRRELKARGIEPGDASRDALREMLLGLQSDSFWMSPGPGERQFDAAVAPPPVSPAALDLPAAASPRGAALARRRLAPVNIW